MNPIFIILYAVIVTLVLTLVFPRFRELSPGGKRLLRISLIAGVVALLIVVFLRFMR